MAGGAAVAPSASAGKRQDYPGGLTLFVFMACMVAATGGLIFGYDIGISGGVTSMDPFLSRFFPSVYREQAESADGGKQYCKFDSQLTLFTSSLYVASLFAASVTRVSGRKWSMFAGGITFLAGCALNGAAVDVAMLILGRVLLGVRLGFANQSVPVCLSEMAPGRMRGMLNNGFLLMITLRILLANLINYGTARIAGGWGWRLSLGLAAVPAAIITICSLLLLERGRPEEAKRMLRRVHGTDDVAAEYDDLVAAGAASRVVAHPRGDIPRRRYRPQLVMAVAIPLFQQLTGINVIMFCAPVLFKTLGFGGTASLMSTVITGLVNLVSHARFGCCAVRGRWAAGFVWLWLLLSLGEADALWSPTTGITASPTAPPPPPPYVGPSEESTPHRHISKCVEILLIGFGVFVLAVFFLATALHYYEQWKRSQRPLLSGGPPRGWRLRQLQRGSEDASPAPVADSSPDYYTAEGELNLSESEQETTEAAHSRLEDAQRSAESADACLAIFRTATYSSSPPPPPPSSPAFRHAVPSTSGRQVHSEIQEEGNDDYDE